MIRKYRYLLTAAAAVGAAGLLTFAARNDFGLGRNMEIAVNMMRELSLNYVDPVDPDRLMVGAAAGISRAPDYNYRWGLVYLRWYMRSWEGNLPMPVPLLVPYSER